MREKDLWEKELCQIFCAYYKPGRNENLTCLGSRVVKVLVAKRADLILTKGSGRAIATERMLLKTMCRQCPFHPEDCDYILRHGDASPCGGFVALSGLLRDQVITIEEIQGAIDRLF